MFRLVYMAFAGERRGADAHAAHDVGHGHADAHGHGHDAHHGGGHLHDAPQAMAIALIVLAIGSVAAGYVGVPHVLGGHDSFGSYLAPSVGEHALGLSETTELLLMAVSVGAALLGMGAAWIMFARNPRADRGIAAGLRSIYPRMQRAYDIDALYDHVVVQPLMRLSDRLWKDVDVAIVDGAANGVASAATGAGGVLRRWSTGNVQHYMLTVLVGVAVVVFALTIAGGL
jgi:NADH-quinone oxidoreductase subunit L